MGSAAVIGIVALLGLTIFLRLRELFSILHDPARQRLIAERLFFVIGLCPWALVWFIRGGTEAEQVEQVLALVAVSICAFIVAGICWLVRQRQRDEPKQDELAEDVWPPVQDRMP